MSEATASRAEDLPPLPTESITFGNSAEASVSLFFPFHLF